MRVRSGWLLQGFGMLCLIGDFRPVVSAGKFVGALVHLPSADDVEGDVDLALQSSAKVVGGSSVA